MIGYRSSLSNITLFLASDVTGTASAFHRMKTEV